MCVMRQSKQIIAERYQAMIGPAYQRLVILTDPSKPADNPVDFPVKATTQK